MPADTVDWRLSSLAQVSGSRFPHLRSKIPLHPREIFLQHHWEDGVESENG